MSNPPPCRPAFEPQCPPTVPVGTSFGWDDGAAAPFAPTFHPRQTGRSSQPACAVNPSLLLVVVIAAAVLLALILARGLSGRRQRAMHQLLDAADALETRLRAARSEIEAVAGELVEGPVHDAMREMLRQRLWLREQGQHASVEELQRVRRSIIDASERIEQQLLKIQRARAPVT